jgi:hypothetical protein
MSEVRTLLINYWMGDANGEMAGRYGKQLLDNVRWRQECAAKVGWTWFHATRRPKQAVVGSLDKFLKSRRVDFVFVRIRHHRNDLGFLNSWFGTRRSVD